MKTLNFFKSTSLIVAIAMVGILGINSTIAADKAPKTKKMTIVEIASADERFSILVEAVVKADLAVALSAEGPYTVFAPTNDAFNQLFTALGVNGVNDLTSEQLTPILLYHVVGAKVMAADVKTGKVQTLNENASMDIKASKSGVKIDKNSNVIITDIEASNGVIHVVDAVLVPASDTQASASGSSCGK
jgi:transforming growth factor-beta-induced protein